MHVLIERCQALLHLRLRLGSLHGMLGLLQLGAELAVLLRKGSQRRSHCAAAARHLPQQRPGRACQSGRHSLIRRWHG